MDKSPIITLTQDELLEEEHNKYLLLKNDLDIPIWILDLYYIGLPFPNPDITPESFLSNQGK